MTAYIQELADTNLPRYIDLLRQLDDRHVMNPDEARDTFKEISQYPFYKIFSVLDEDRLLGTYTLIILDNFGHGGRKIAVVENVVVVPDARGKGIGRLMMAHAMKQAEAENCYKLMLSSDIRRHDAHQFYEHLGFTQHGISFRIEVEEKP